MIDMGQDKAAEHEEHVDGKIAFVDQVSMRPDIEIGKTLNAIVVNHHPKSCESTQGGEAGQLLLG